LGLKAVKAFAELDDALRSDGEWLEPLRRLQQNGNNNLLDFRAADDFLTWSASDPDRARSAILDLWDSTASLRKRVQRFADTVGKGVGSPGNRTAQAAYLLMARDPAEWPMYRPEPFESFLALVGAAHRSSEGDRYSQAVQTCDELSAELEERDAFCRWRGGTTAPASSSSDSADTSDDEETTAPEAGFEDRLSSAAAKIHLPVSYLRDLTELLLESDKKQVCSRFGGLGSMSCPVSRSVDRHGGPSSESHSFRQHKEDRVSAKENLVRTLDLRPSCDSTEFERDLQAAFGKVPGSDAPAV
jgi:hypothetical protein